MLAGDLMNTQIKLLHQKTWYYIILKYLMKNEDVT